MFRKWWSGYTFFEDVLKLIGLKMGFVIIEMVAKRFYIVTVIAIFLSVGISAVLFNQFVFWTSHINRT